MTREVDGNDVMIIGKRVDDRVPRSTGETVAVQQDHRFAISETIEREPFGAVRGTRFGVIRGIIDFLG